MKHVDGGRVEFAELDNRKGSRSKLVTGYRFQLDQESRERNNNRESFAESVRRIGWRGFHQPFVTVGDGLLKSRLIIDDPATLLSQLSSLNDEQKPDFEESNRFRIGIRAGLLLCNSHTHYAASSRSNCKSHSPFQQVTHRKIWGDDDRNVAGRSRLHRLPPLRESFRARLEAEPQ